MYFYFIAEKRLGGLDILVEGNLRRCRGLHDQTLVLVVRRLDDTAPRHHVSNVQPANKNAQDISTAPTSRSHLLP